MGGSSLEPPVHFEPVPRNQCYGFAPARVAATGKNSPCLTKLLSDFRFRARVEGIGTYCQGEEIEVILLEMLHVVQPFRQ